MNKKILDIIEKYDIQEVKGMYIMDKDNIEKFADCAADSYSDYPLFDYFSKEKDMFDAKFATFMTNYKSMMDTALVLGSSENVEAHAVFMPPHTKEISAVSFMRYGGLNVVKKYGIKAVINMLRYEDFATKLRMKYTNNDCWYWFNLSCKTIYQRKGFATKTITPMFDYFDRTKQAVYLETNKDMNVEIYKKFGYEVLEKTTIPGTNILHVAMLRNPKK